MNYVRILTGSLLLIASSFVLANDSGAVVDVEPVAVDLSQTEQIILDVRTPQEYAAGHIKGAINVSVHDKTFENQIAQLDPSKHYIVHCAVNPPNGRAARAIEALQKQGFKHLTNLSGGIRAWRSSGRTVTVPDAE